jgi:tripartite-type tricarboxylate transporter receptor subunit TctC
MKRLFLAFVLAAFSLPLAAQNYPNKTVRIIGPFAAGAGSDVLARMLAQKLNDAFGQYFIVENRAGATGTIGAAFVAKAPPDGSALILHSSSTFLAGFMYRSLSYDPVKSFAPVINCVTYPFYIVSSAALPIKTVPQLVALAKKHPGELTSGSPGMGSGGHLVMEMFNSAAGTKIVHVPFKGSGPAMTAAASGEVSLVVTSILSGEQFVKIGKLRGLAITGATRSKSVPNVPTLVESGVPLEAYLWMGIFTTAGTPAPIINQLNTALTRILSAQELKDWLSNSIGGEFAPNTPEQFAAFITNDVAQWQKVIKDIGVMLD